MNANELADELEAFYVDPDGFPYMIDEAVTMLRQQKAEIEALEKRIERMIEKQSHYEAMAHAGGFEAGRELGMKQERALWELAASTQEIEK
jgi:flagellar biosynthesis/type III secretory pathway protein FliH